jgi:hypothetical protein
MPITCLDLWLQCAFRSADIADCHLFVVHNGAEAALSLVNAHGDKILNCFITCVDK